MPKQQSQLEKARSRAETLTKFAIKQHNRRARDLKSQRVKSEEKAEEMVARQEERYRNYIKAQQINANSGGGMAGAMQGGMTGASLGGMVGGPWGALAGGLIGAAGGGLYGASEGRQAVAQLAPYAAGISQVAGGISQMQANKERTAAMGKMYGQQGGGQPAGFGAPQWSGPQWDTPVGPQTAGGISLTGGQGLAAPYVPTGGTLSDPVSSPHVPGTSAAPFMGPMGAKTDSYRARGGGISGSPHLNYYLDQLNRKPFANMGDRERF